jgi:hypothetical protein
MGVGDRVIVAALVNGAEIRWRDCRISAREVLASDLQCLIVREVELHPSLCS